MIHYSVNSPSTLLPSLPNAKREGKEHSAFDPSILPCTVPKTPCHGEKNKDIPEEIHSQTPGKMKGRLFANFIPRASHGAFSDGLLMKKIFIQSTILKKQHMVYVEICLTMSHQVKTQGLYH